MIETVDPAALAVREVLGGFEVLDDQDLTDALQARVAARRRMDAEDAAFFRVLHNRIVDANNGFLAGACAEIGLMLGISTRSAEFLVDAGYELTSRPVVWQALRDGLIDQVKARKIVTVLDGFTDPERTELERIAVGYAATHTAAQLHRRLVRMTCDEDPDEKARRAAIGNRGVSLIEAGHGMAIVSIYTSVEHAVAFVAGIDRLAAAGDCPDPYRQGDSRSAEQRRADALIGFLEDHSFWDVAV